MVCWSITSTVAGISRTVRPSRLALEATVLVFNGEAPGAVESRVGAGASGLVAARCTARPEMRAGIASGSTGFTRLRFGALTITGSIWPGGDKEGGAPCADAGTTAAEKEATKATDEDAKCARETFGAKRRWRMKIDTMIVLAANAQPSPAVAAKSCLRPFGRYSNYSRHSG